MEESTHMARSPNQILHHRLEWDYLLHVYFPDKMQCTDLDGVSAGPVTCTHVPVALSNCPRHCEVTVLTVHIVGTRAGVITQPNADVFHNARLTFHDLPSGHAMSK